MLAKVWVGLGFSAVQNGSVPCDWGKFEECSGILELRLRHEVDWGGLPVAQRLILVDFVSPGGGRGVH